MSFKKSISNKSLFLFCWLFFCVFMNSGPGHGNCKKNVNIDWQDWKSLHPYPHFKHFENNGVWCDWINEIAQTVKRAHILYINLIIFTWQKWRKRKREREREEGEAEEAGSRGFGFRITSKGAIKVDGLARQWCADWLGLSLPDWACLAYISHGL